MDQPTLMRLLELVARGAVMSPGGTRVLLDRAELFPTGLFYREAANSNGYAGHLLEFDQAKALPGGGVEFRDAAGNRVAYVTWIDDADLDDPSIYQATLSAWREAMQDPDRRAEEDAAAASEKLDLGIGGQR
ncbi:MAG: hypothetical protein HZA88_00525 [Verrucomicrobia bacterium]|nr:hypothetical protein [Verrucomicrobiota bacterium]